MCLLGFWVVSTRDCADIAGRRTHLVNHPISPNSDDGKGKGSVANLDTVDDHCLRRAYDPARHAAMLSCDRFVAQSKPSTPESATVAFSAIP